MRHRVLQLTICIFLGCICTLPIQSQINTNRVLAIGKNALYFEDYVLSIQYFNQVIKSKPYLAEPYLYRAMAKLSLDDYGGAEADLDLCLERNPFLVYAYLYRGVARQSLGNYDGAIEDYNKGLEFRPDNKQMLMNKGIAYAQKKDYDDAVNSFNDLIQAQPRHTQSYLTRGAVYAEKGDTLLALDDFNKAIELDKYFAPSYAQRAMIHYMQENYQEALNDYNQAIHLDSRQVGYYINRGLVRYNLNDLRGAMSDYDAVVILDPQNTIARFNRGLLKAQVGDVNQAIEDFNVVIQNEPDNFMAIYNRALLNEEARNYKDAIADLNTVLEEYPYFVPGYHFRSEVKRKKHDVKGADTDYWYAYDLEQKLLRERNKGKIVTGKEILDADEVTAEELADEGKKTRQKSDKDIQKFNRLVVYDREEEIKSSYKNEIRGRVQDKQVKVELQPQFVITYYEKETSELDQLISRFDKSISDFNAKRVLDLQLRITNQEAALTDIQAQYHFQSIDDFSLRLDRNPENVNAYFGRALDYMVLQDLTESIDDFTKVINLNPDFYLAYFNRAVVRYKQMELENYEGAITNVMDISLNIQTAPNKPSQNQNLPVSSFSGIKDQNLSGTSQAETKRLFEFDQIMRDYAKVIELNPDFVYAYFNRANILCAQRDFRAALVDYNEAINRNANFPEAYYNRGLTRLYLGDIEKGISDLSKAGELGIIEAYSIIKRMTLD